MSKAKSVVITVLLAVIMAVAAFFAFVSFPVANNVKRYNSFLSNIPLGADYTGYAYTTLYPEGVYTKEEYNGYIEDGAAESDYTAVGGLYVKNDTVTDIEALKEQVASDAEKLNHRFGQKGYSSYSVAVEDGISIKISVPTDFTSSEYSGNSSDNRSTTLSSASYTISRLISAGELTMRTASSSLGSKDEWTKKATVTNSDSETVETYTLFSGDISKYFKSISGGRIGTTAVITFRFTKEGREAINDITTTVAANSDDQTIYFFVGDSQLVSYSCTEAIDSSKIQLQASDEVTARDVGIAMNSAISGEALEVTYRDIENVIASEAPLGNLSALLMFIACLLVIAGIIALLIVKYKKLGLVTSMIVLLFMLVEIYALYLLDIQVTFAVALVGLALIGLYAVSCAIVYVEVKKLTSVGRTVQASVKDAYKNVIMTVSDLHIVLLALAILLASVCVGEVAACGLLAVVGVVASYVLYWFTRFMWYVTSAPVRDKFMFAGLKRVVYEDD